MTLTRRLVLMNPIPLPNNNIYFKYLSSVALNCIYRPNLLHQVHEDERRDEPRNAAAWSLLGQQRVGEGET